jgi:hypothetical protein
MCLLSITWALVQTIILSRMNMDPNKVKSQFQKKIDWTGVEMEDHSDDHGDQPKNFQECFNMMKHIAKLI